MNIEKEITYTVYNSMRVSVGDAVGDSVYAPVWGDVGASVRNPVWDCVYASLVFTVSNTIKENEY